MGEVTSSTSIHTIGFIQKCFNTVALIGPEGMSFLQYT